MTTKSTRRAILAGAAATSPRTVLELRKALATAATDWSAMADRFEIIVDCMTNLAVAETITVDRRVAARVVKYHRRLAAGGRSNTN